MENSLIKPVQKCNIDIILFGFRGREYVEKIKA